MDHKPEFKMLSLELLEDNTEKLDDLEFGDEVSGATPPA
jgi:hypothetical protein